MDKGLWKKCVDFHGHECPGLAIGFKACEGAIEELGLAFSDDEQVVCITENDACGVDAIQVILSCTLGKGNLIYRDVGKQAFSFFDRKTGKSIRMVLKSFNGNMDRHERQEYILNAPIDEIFEYKEPRYNLPERARIFNTIICDECNEGAAEHRIRLQEGKKLCLDCFKNYDRGW